MNSQQELVLMFAETMIKTVKASQYDHVKIKEAVVAFIEAMDTHTHVVGDTDLAGIAARALQRRGKSIGTLPAMAQAAEVGEKAFKAGK
jgi:hypothetical protein